MKIVGKEGGSGITSEASERTTSTAMQRLMSLRVTERFEPSGGQSARHPLKDAPEKQTSRGSHTSRASSERGLSEQHLTGQQTVRQEQLKGQLSVKVKSRLAEQRAKREQEARMHASAAALAAQTTSSAEHLRVRRRAQQFAQARANEEEELKDLMARVGATPGAVGQGARRLLRQAPVLPTATALPAPDPVGGTADGGFSA